MDGWIVTLGEEQLRPLIHFGRVTLTETDSADLATLYQKHHEASELCNFIMHIINVIPFECSGFSYSNDTSLDITLLKESHIVIRKGRVRPLSNCKSKITSQSTLIAEH